MFSGFIAKMLIDVLSKFGNYYGWYWVCDYWGGMGIWIYSHYCLIFDLIDHGYY